MQPQIVPPTSVTKRDPIAIGCSGSSLPIFTSGFIGTITESPANIKKFTDIALLKQISVFISKIDLNLKVIFRGFGNEQFRSHGGKQSRYPFKSSLRSGLYVLSLARCRWGFRNEGAVHSTTKSSKNIKKYMHSFPKNKKTRVLAHSIPVLNPFHQKPRKNYNSAIRQYLRTGYHCLNQYQAASVDARK